MIKKSIKYDPSLSKSNESWSNDFNGKQMFILKKLCSIAMKLKLRQFKKELVGTGSTQYVLFPKPIKWLVNLSNKL